MSKPVKEMMMTAYKHRFEDLEGALIIDIRGIEANDNNELRLALAEKKIVVTVLKNTLATKAFEGTKLEAIIPAIDGPSALAYGGDSVVDVARELVDWAKKVADLDLKGAVLDGEYYEGHAGVAKVSKFPTQEEAKARIVQLVLTPAGNLVGAAKAPGANILGIVKELQERLEEGKTIEKIA